jgi:capping protein beta
MEAEANELFDAYRELYFEGGTSSVYLWDMDQGFAGCFLIKKKVEGTEFVKQGCWDSIHVIEVITLKNIQKKKAYYLILLIGKRRKFN